ncbi:hypothetical protein OIU84_006948 [Salix udensis]|uniref:Endonuclease/exonuclease/phosphatase domain-containing protein n=1 Tax=Salix udensis TaxID=889485 RepID=A0AAD6P2T0_9ROSI|nr:hypothetical protein OIU84_006948 [Salix udensis]
MSNIQYNPHCRIIVGWNAQHMHIQCIEASAQWLTCEIQNHPTLLGTRLTFVYGSNKPNERADLWSYIHAASDRHHQTPWAILGDFNAILRPSDRSGGSMDWTRQHDAFSDCIMQSSLRQTPYSGIHLTWHNGQEGGGTIMKKLDWVFGNFPLHTTWPAARAVFLPRQNSDHSAMILRLEAAPPRDKCSFKFINLWAQHGDFMEIVQGVWNQHIVGNPMFQLTAKLGILKQHLRRKHHNSTSHISHRVFTARKAWNTAQESLDRDPQNVTMGDTERHLAKTYMNLCKEEEAFYKQRSRVQWLTLGDHNTKFFHRSLLHRNARNTISSLQDDVGRIHTGQQPRGIMQPRGTLNLSIRELFLRKPEL